MADSAASLEPIFADTVVVDSGLRTALGHGMTGPITAAISISLLSKIYAGGFQALKDFGIRCVISTSFGDIFYNNCFKNGILPIRVSQEDLDKLFDDAGRGSNATLTIDLPNQEIRGPDGGKVKFEIESFRKHCLINGLDDIGLTMEKKSSIDAYEAKAKAERAWA